MFSYLDKADVKSDVKTNPFENNNGNNNEAASEIGSDGNFIDDDFGLSSMRQESELIRQQQLIIEQEVILGFIIYSTIKNFSIYVLKQISKLSY